MINKDSTLQEFIELGLEEVQKEFEIYIGAPIIFETLEKAHHWWVNFNKQFYAIDKHAPEGFISKSCAYIFYLTKLEGKQRNKLLGITDDMYEDSKKAKKWFKDVSKYVHPDVTKGNNPDGIAFIELKKIFDVMIEKDDEEAEDNING